MTFVSARKSLYLIAVAAIGMSAFQLAVAQEPSAEPTGSSYPSVSAYPSEYPSQSSYPSGAPTEVPHPSMTPVAIMTPSPTSSPTSSATTSPTTIPAAVTLTPTSINTVVCSVNVCPEDCASLEESAQSPEFLALMAEQFIPYDVFYAEFIASSGCSPCLDDPRARVLQTGGSTLTFVFGSANLTFTDETAAQAFANNLDGLSALAEALQPGLTMDPASLIVGPILVQPLTAAPTMAPTKGPKDSKKSKKDKKKKDKKTKKKKDSDAPTTDAPTKAPKSPKAAKKGKKDKAGKKEKTAKADKKYKR